MHITPDLRPADAAYSTYRVTATHNATPADIKQPSALWLVSNKLRVGDIVEVMPAVMAWRVVLLVTKIDAETCNVFTRVLFEHDWTEAAAQWADMTEAFVQFKGVQLRWCVCIGSNIVKKGFDTEAEAIAWVAKKAGLGLDMPVPMMQAAAPAALPVSAEQQAAARQRPKPPRADAA